MPSQRPFFLSTVFAAFRQQTTAATSLATAPAQPSKQTSSSYSTAAAAAAARGVAAGSSPSSQQSSGLPNSNSNGSMTSSSQQQQQQQSSPSSALHSPRATTPGTGVTTTAGIPIPCPGRRRGSDSSTEGFRNVRGADKWYIGGRTATGEERFFKLGVIRRVRSNDRLSLDRLSL